MRGRPPELDHEAKLRIRKLREEGFSIANCAGAYDISEATVYRVLAELRRRYGPEKLPRGQSARWHLIARNIDDMQAQ